MTKDISAEGLMAIYESLDRNATGKVAVKISSGAHGGHYFLSPKLRLKETAILLIILRLQMWMNMILSFSGIQSM
ncbi:hypothetical protein [Clostridium estertheticum]|nr:hypothetical protein [Clostridium estertheticum]MCB2358491.1 hypothetical protein [Clostridium estertheticum]